MAESLSSITGISSGIDSKALVEQIIKLERRPADRMQATIDGNAKRADALSQLQKAIETLKKSADGIADGSTLTGYSVSVSGQAANGRALLTSSAGTGALPGSYQVRVLDLASTQKLTATTGQASATTALNLTGAFDLRRPDGTVVGSVDVAGKSLADIRDAINALPASAKVQATIVSTRSDGTDQRLVIGSTQAGAAGRFGLVATSGDPLTGLGLAAPLERPGTDARVEVDGVEVTRPTNTLTDVIAGVTMSLSTADQAATATVTVDRLKSAVHDAAQGMVDAYNTVQALVKAQSGADAPLAKEPLLRSARAALSGVVLGEGAGLPAGAATLGSVGVSLTKDGTLQLDSATFDAAYDRGFDGLKATLANRATAMSALAQSLVAPATGSIARREQALTDMSASLTGRITDIDSRLDKKRTALLAQYAKFEASLGRINALSTNITTQLAGLNKSSSN